MTEEATTQTIGDETTGQVTNVPVESTEQDKVNQDTAQQPERPEWLPEKFKTPEDMVKSFTQLEGKLREKGKLAPESYAMPEDMLETVDTEAEDYAAFTEVAKEIGLTNDGFNKLVSFAVDAGLILPKNAFEKEMEALGAEGEAMVSTVTNFMNQNLSKEEQQVFKTMAYTADQLRVLHKVLRMSGAKAIPGKQSSQSDESVENLQAKLNKVLSDPNIRNDRNLQAESMRLSQMLASARKNV